MRPWIVVLIAVVAGGAGAGCGSSGSAADGAAGATSTGSAGTASSGAAGATSTGSAGQSPSTGAAGATSTGGAGMRSTGAAGATSTGAAGARSTGAAGAPSTGAAGAASTGAAGMTAAGGSGGAAPIGNPGGPCAVPAAAAAVDVKTPTTVVGDGTAASCTAAKVAAAIAGGGVVTFSCGADPLTIVVPEIAIVNDGGVTHDGSVTIDGGGKVTLSGGGKNRILRQNPCDQSLHFTTAHCNNQTTPHLVVQNIGFTDGAGLAEQIDQKGVLGGGAIFVGGGTFKAVNVTFSNNRQTNATGQLVQDLAGGAIYTTNMSSPGVAYLVNCTFAGNSGINGGALGSISTSWTILNSAFKNDAATGHGENPAHAGTEGGGLGGAIYNDGNNYTLTICGSQFSADMANELGSGAIFQVVDNLQGNLVIDQSTFTGNSDTGDVQSGAKHPGIYVQARDQVSGTSGVMITNTTFN